MIDMIDIMTMNKDIWTAEIIFLPKNILHYDGPVRKTGSRLFTCQALARFMKNCAFKHKQRGNKL